VFVAVPKDELRWIGTVSSSILGPATEKTPQQNPKQNLPITIMGRLRNIVSVTEIAASKLKIMMAILLPLWMNLPPTRDPATTPKIAAELMSVLNLVASSLLHPNLALITGAVWLFPEMAKPVYMFPRPSTKVKTHRRQMFAS
jgi:hypothetical protein